MMQNPCQYTCPPKKQRSLRKELASSFFDTYLNTKCTNTTKNMQTWSDTCKNGRQKRVQKRTPSKRNSADCGRSSPPRPASSASLSAWRLRSRRPCWSSSGGRQRRLFFFLGLHAPLLGLLFRHFSSQLWQLIGSVPAVLHSSAYLLHAFTFAMLYHFMRSSYFLVVLQWWFIMYKQQ